MRRNLFVWTSVFVIFFCMIFLFHNVSSKNDLSEKIDQNSNEELSKIFGNNSYTQDLITKNNSIKVKIEDGETWAKINVDLKASPEFEITEDMNFTRDERREFTEKRSAYFEDLINETLDDILGDNIQLSRRAPEGFQVWVNEEGLSVILQNTNVERIDYSVSDITYVPYLSPLNPNGSNFFFLILSVFVFSFLLFLLFKLIKKRRNHVKKN